MDEFSITIKGKTYDISVSHKQFDIVPVTHTDNDPNIPAIAKLIMQGHPSFNAPTLGKLLVKLPHE